MDQRYELRGSTPPTPVAGRKYVSTITNDEEARFVPDAYGAQLLGLEHQAHTTKLQRWIREPVGDITWVRSRDPTSWFAALPEPALVQGAREDFGSAILTPEQFSHAFNRERDRPTKRESHMTWNTLAGTVVDCN